MKSYDKKFRLGSFREQDAEFRVLNVPLSVVAQTHRFNLAK